jgi:hypothetical protein
MSNQLEEVIIQDYHPQLPTLFEQEKEVVIILLKNQKVIYHSKNAFYEDGTAYRKRRV